MKIKVLDYSLINKSKLNEKIIFDVKIIENENDLLVNKRFSTDNGDLSFKVLSVGHINPPIENFYPITIEIEGDHKLEKFKNHIFTDIN